MSREILSAFLYYYKGEGYRKDDSLKKDVYIDEYQKTIQSKVIECIKVKKGYDIVLENTCFYPEGGGQPADKGILDGQEVLDVQKKQGMIYHTVKKSIEIGKEVNGSIDWEYHFDLTQNHTAEHIISGLVYQLYGFHNVGFHMGKEAIILDFDGKLCAEQVEEVEKKANEAIMQNKTVKIYYPDKQQLSKLCYRSKKALEGVVRIVEVPGYDICACCGTHTKTTGEIGCIKIISFQNYKGGTRLSMMAGKRALQDYNQKSKNVDAISHLLCVPTNDILQAVEKLKKEKDMLHFQMNMLEKEKLEQIAKTVEQGSKKAIFFEKIHNNKTLQYFASLLSERAEIAAVFSGEEKEGYHYILMSQKRDMKELKQKLSETFQCNGGGTNEMIQGKIQSTECDIIHFFDKL